MAGSSRGAKLGWQRRRLRSVDESGVPQQPAVRSGQVSDNGQPMDDKLPPKLYDSVIEVMRSYVTLVYGILRNSDLAYRRDRVLQRQMRNDPDIMSPLLQRQIAVALLDFDIIPEDKKDKQQVKEAARVKIALQHTLQRPHDCWRHLSEAVWYGPSAVNMIYQRAPDGFISPVKWVPFHPDTLTFTEEGELGFRVGIQYNGPKLITWDGWTHLLDPLERKATALHTFMVQGPDYEEQFEARYHYSGRGLRDVVWFQWFMKQTALQMWMTYVQRYGMGIRVGYFPAGNKEGRDEMDKVLRNLLGDVSVLVPRDADGAKGQYGLEVIDPPGGGEVKVFADLIEGYLAGQIKELIIGQTATTEATSTGMGSDVGTRHAETFDRLIRFDAKALDDTITREIVWVICEMNYGDRPYRPRFEFNLEVVDSEKFMKGVEAFIRSGGTVKADQVRSEMGLEEPEEGDDVLGGMDEEFGGLGGGGLDFKKLREAVGVGGGGRTGGNGQAAAAK